MWQLRTLHRRYRCRPANPATGKHTGSINPLIAPGVEIFVATTGDDDGAGTKAAPLKYKVDRRGAACGLWAQAMVRRRYPTVSSRPAITVLVEGGDYYFGAAGPGRLSRGTSYSATPPFSLVLFFSNIALGGGTIADNDLRSVHVHTVYDSVNGLSL